MSRKSDIFTVKEDDKEQDDETIKTEKYLESSNESNDSYSEQSRSGN